MTTSLLVSAFPHEVLLKSNYKGAKSKKTEEKTQKYEPLDSDIINAIKGLISLFLFINIYIFLLLHLL